MRTWCAFILGSHMNVQYRISQLLIKQSEEQQHPLRTLIPTDDPSETCHFLFSNYRGDLETGKGFRLSDVGLQLMKTFFKSHEVALPGGYKLAKNHLIYLDRIAVMPYWINDSYIISFDSDLAMMLKLNDGSIQNLLDSRFRIE